MRRFGLSGLLVVAWTAATLFAGGGDLGQLSLQRGKVSIAVRSDCVPVVRFAADELACFLGRVLGSKPQVSFRSPGRCAEDADGVTVVLGDCRESRSNGLDVGVLRRDGFFRLVKGRCVYLLGRDDPRRDPAKTAAGTGDYMYERATLFAVYDFLERFAGCRFFFPGELGTVVPRRERIDVPYGLERTEPVFTERYYAAHRAGKVWHDASVRMSAVQGLNNLRLRLGTQRIPCSHGQREFRYVRRFGSDHPDWFCLQADGTRHIRDGASSHSRNGKLCYSSPVVEELYQDVKAYLEGRPASYRGLQRWGRNCVGGCYVDIMPEDSLMECHCSDCQKVYDKSRPMYATDQIWRLTADIASRLQRDGVKGSVCQMAYPPYRDVPAFPLPDNVQVMVAENGPWSTHNESAIQEQLNELKAWSGKLGHKVWVWTYPGKYGGRYRDIPQISPRAYANFFRRAAPYIMGGYAEIDTDRFIYDALNVYVFAKLGWDPEADIEALLDDWHASLFGGAAPAMKKMFDLLEELWVHGVQDSKTIDTPLGPVTPQRSPGDLWAKIYTPANMERLSSLLESARRSVPSDSREGRCVELIANEMIKPLAAKADEASVALELKSRKSRKPVNLLVNGAFETLDGWKAGVKDAEVVLDPVIKVSGTSSVRLSTVASVDYDRYLYVSLEQSLKLRKGRKYRLSYMLKARNVATYRYGEGAGLCLWEGRSLYSKYPRPLITGTCDWVHFAHEFVARDDDARIQFRICEATGTMWLDEILLEELP